MLSDGIEGRVVETNWRATHLLNGSNDLVVLPNSDLAKAQLTNLSSPNRSHGVKLSVRVVPTMAPSAISEIMRTVLLSSNSIMPTPAPTVEIKSLDAQAIEFELSFRVRDFATAAAARHEVYDLIYRHARAAGLTLAQPKEAVTMLAGPPSGRRPPLRPRRTPRRCGCSTRCRCSPRLTEEEKEALAATMTRRTYRKGEMLVEQGAKLNVALRDPHRRAVVVRAATGDREVELSRLVARRLFRRGGLFTGAGEPGTMRALTFAVVYEVGPGGARQAHARSAEHRRRDQRDPVAPRQAFAAGIGRRWREATSMRSVSWLVARIRNVFELP